MTDNIPVVDCTHYLDTETMTIHEGTPPNIRRPLTHLDQGRYKAFTAEVLLAWVEMLGALRDLHNDPNLDEVDRDIASYEILFK